MNDHGRLHWFAPGELDEPQNLLYESITGGARAKAPRTFSLTDEAGRLNGPFNAMLVTPNVGAPLQEVGSAIRYKTTFTARAREIAILELAALRKSEFEWYAHVRVGKHAGLTDDEIGALRTGTPAPTLDAQETLIRNLARTIATERDLDDATFSAALEALGRERLNDLIVLVGYYDLLSLSLNIWRTPLPPDGAPVFS